MWLRVVSFVFLVALAPGQDTVWRLPERGGAEYRRVGTMHSDTAEKRSDAEKLAAKGRVPGEFTAHLPPAAWLCQGELTDDQRAVLGSPRELRDVLRDVAFDLRLAGTTRLRLPRIVPFGDLELKGRVPALDAEGNQSFALDVATASPDALPGESKADLTRFVRGLCKYDANGSLSITRRVDATAGVVQSFAAELLLVFEEKKDQWRKLVISERWDLAAVRENQDAAFRGDVAAAIRSGSKWIKGQLAAYDKRYMTDARNQKRSYGSGRIALALLTLLHAEVPADDPVVTATFAELERRELIDTYTLGVALMAMAARYAPPGEAELVRSGVLKAPGPRTLTAADRALAERWLAQVRGNIDTRVDEAYRLRFNYVPGPRWDNSVNQYGLLGLHAAVLCQLDVPVTLWRAAAAHLLDVQADDIGDRRVQHSTYLELRAAAGGPLATRGSGPRVPMRGFAYYGPTSSPSYGSMTTAGITGLVLAEDGMHRAGLAKADLMPKVEEALAASLAWLSGEFTVRSNPGFIGRAHDHWYYYLYGLERACELSGLALLDGRDWYFEGAVQLLGRQQPNGAFPADAASGEALDATCFAVLFLKKATLAAATGR